MSFKLQSLLLVALLVVATTSSAADAAAPGGDAAYRQVTLARAAKIVATLGLTNTSHADRVTEIIASQYQQLAAIHGERDAKIEAGRTTPDADKAVRDAEIQKLRDEARASTDELHKTFLVRLAVELSSAQVEQVKDGMTYGVAPNTYRVYLRMYPAMTDEQRRQVLDWLHEAREIAMNAGDSKEKHAVFGKYKGRINNYLVKHGFDLKQGEANLKKASSPASGTESK